MSKKTFTCNRVVAKEAIEIKSRDVSHSLTDDWLAVSSSSDIHNLFPKLNKLFFWGKLDGVKLEWSNKMTLCAGKCYISPRQKYYCIRLSRPLLSQRPHSDLINTLLHEMIHAYQAVTKTMDDESHGTKFQEHMHRINKAVGTNISVYHTFHAEVESLKQHWWRCVGPCRKLSPFFGWIKRATNRAPGPYDSWWRSHSHRCGGRFVKVKEPMEYTKQRVKGLFGYGVSLPTSSLALNNFGFEFMHCGETFGRQKKGEIAPPYEFVLTGQKITGNDLIDCPISTKRISRRILSEHFKVCGDVQRCFEEDQVDLSEKVCVDRRKNEVDISTCPACNEALFEGFIKEHLEKCDGLKEISDDDNFVRTDVTSPFMEVQSDLSSHISRCLSGDTLRISDGNDVESRSEGEEGIEKCLVCKKTLSKISLKDHLESCEGLQGVFDDDIITLEDESVCEGSVVTNCVQHCPFCDSEVADLADHFSKCLSSYNKPNLTYTATDIQTVGLKGVFDDDIVILEDESDCEESVVTNCVQHCPFCDSEVADLADHFSKCLSSYDKPSLTYTATDIQTVGLKGVFDDDIVILEDESDCKDSVVTNCCVQHCPFCDSEVADLADHFSKCLSSYDKPSLTYTATDVQTVTSINSSGVNTGLRALNTCLICGLEVRNGLKYHLKRECSSIVDISKELDLSFSPGKNKASVRNTCVAQEFLGKNALKKKIK